MIETSTGCRGAPVRLYKKTSQQPKRPEQCTDNNVSNNGISFAAVFHGVVYWFLTHQHTTNTQPLTDDNRRGTHWRPEEVNE